MVLNVVAPPHCCVAKAPLGHRVLDPASGLSDVSTIRSVSPTTHPFTGAQRYEPPPVTGAHFPPDPPRTWIFGFAPDATLLDIILVHMFGKDLVIHCMKAHECELDKALRVRRGK